MYLYDGMQNNLLDFGSNLHKLFSPLCFITKQHSLLITQSWTFAVAITYAVP